MELDYNKIIKSRQENENTKYTDKYLKKKIRIRIKKLKNMSGDINICLESGELVYNMRSIGQNPEMNDIIEEINILLQIIDRL